MVRFQNNKEKWVAFVGLLDGYPYEIFTGLQDDEEGIVLPKTVTKGKIIKQTDENGKHRYDFQFENKRGYKTTVEGLSEKFNPEYWNYAKPDLRRAALPYAHRTRDKSFVLSPAKERKYQHMEERRGARAQEIRHRRHRGERPEMPCLRTGDPRLPRRMPHLQELRSLKMRII